MGKQRRGLLSQMIRRVIWTPSFIMPVLAGGLLAYAAEGTFIGMLGAGLLIVCIFNAAAKWTWGRARLEKSALQDLLKKQRREHLTHLDDVRSSMRRDRDPRTSDLVKQLRGIFERLWTLTPDPNSEWKETPEVYQQAMELYQSCLTLLKRTFELWIASKSVSTDRARHQLLDSRDELLGQVEASIDHLNASLDSLQTSGIDRTREELALHNSQLQKELEQGLEVARAVEKRMDELEREIRVSEQI